MTRDIKLYFEEILESINKVQKYTDHFSKEQFLKSDQLQDAVIRRFILIGEASTKVPEKIKKDYPDIFWSQITGMRNLIIHAYFEINLERVWKTVKEDFPVFKKQVLKILEEWK